MIRLSEEEKKETDSKDVEILELPPKPNSDDVLTEDAKKLEDEKELEELKPIEEIEPEPERQQRGFVWTPEIISAGMNFLKEFLGTGLADKYLANKKNDADAKRHYFETVSQHNRRMIYVLLAFLIGIVGFMSLLTWCGSVSGDALLFLVGTITGYVLLFIQRLVFPSKETPPSEEELAMT